MKIGFILPSCPPTPSGGAKIVYEYANYLCEKNDVTIYFMMDRFMKRRLVPQFVKKLLAKCLVFMQPSWFDLKKKIHKRIVYSKDDIDRLQVLIATALPTAKLLNQIADPKIKKYYFVQGFENWKCNDEDVFESYSYNMTKITVAKWLKQIIDEHSDTSAHYVSNCINLQIFNVKSALQSRKRHSVTFHYRQSPIKGCSYAIETIKQLKKIYDDLEVNVISVEKKPDCLPDFCKYYYNLKPDEVAAVLNKTKVFICSSVCEGFGLPGLEAMACGCALVSSEFRGALEYAINEKNSLLSPVEDSNSMTQNVIRLFEDENLYYRIVNEGIKTASGRSISESAKKFAGIVTEDF